MELPAPIPSCDEPVVCMAVPAIRVKLFADAFNVAQGIKSLLIESQEGLSLCSGIELVT